MWLAAEELGATADSMHRRHPVTFIAAIGKEEQMKHLQDIRNAMTSRSAVLLAVGVALLGAVTAYRRRQKR